MYQDLSYFELADLVGWSLVKDLFKEHGCVWVDCPEMRWYEESWGALMKGHLANPYDLDDEYLKGLTNPDIEYGNFLKGEVIVKLRAICLLMMYFGFCKRGFDEERYPHPLEEMLDTLEIDPMALANIAGVKIPNINVPDGDSFSFCKMSDFVEEETWGLIEDEIWSVISRETSLVYGCLKKHYGGESMLYVALSNSRRPLWALESTDSILGPDITIPEIAERMDGFTYVQDGMSEWVW